MAVPEKYSHIDFTPNDAMANEAERGLAWRKEFGRGGTGVGVARARQLSNKQELSPSTVKRMFSFFSRHEVDKKGQGWSPSAEGYPSNGRIAWALWGGDAGFSWSRQRVGQLNAADSAKNYHTVDPTKNRRNVDSAPNLRPSEVMEIPPSCADCAFFQMGSRLCTMHNFETSYTWLCDDWTDDTGLFEKDDSAILLATFPNNTTLLAIQQAVLAKIPISANHNLIPTDAKDFHMTLVYLTEGLDDALPLPVIEEAKIELTTSHVEIWETSEDEYCSTYAIVLRFEDSEELRALQVALYDHCVANNTVISDYSNPFMWKPHVTLGWITEYESEEEEEDEEGTEIEIEITIPSRTVPEYELEELKFPPLKPLKITLTNVIFENKYKQQFKVPLRNVVRMAWMPETDVEE